MNADMQQTKRLPPSESKSQLRRQSTDDRTLHSRKSDMISNIFAIPEKDTQNQNHLEVKD
jgi:hypothetical protein